MMDVRAEVIVCRGVVRMLLWFSVWNLIVMIVFSVQERCFPYPALTI